MIKGIVFFDYDGTLTDENKGIYRPSEITKNAIKTLQENGYMAVLATGRGKSYLPETGINFDAFVMNNGAYVEYEGKEIFGYYIDEKIVDELIEDMDKLNLAYGFDAKESSYTKDYDIPLFKGMAENFDLPRSAFAPLDEMNKKQVCKLIMAYNDPKEIEELEEKYKGILVFDKHRKFYSCDISRFGVHKGIGIKKLAEELNVDMENTYAFGDGTNDYDMMKTVAHGVALKDHAGILDEVVEFVTETVENNGVAEGLKTLKLI